MAENEKMNEEIIEENLQQDAEQSAPQAPVDEEPLDVDDDDNEIERLQAELDAAEEKYLRLYAEFENYKKRTRAELDTERAYRSQSVLRDIIPTLDNIERALQQEVDENDALYKGVKMVHESLVNTLKDHGLETIEAQDAPFDPNFHQAVMQEANPDKESGLVLEELQKGYKLKERVLRPSMVKVNE